LVFSERDGGHGSEREESGDSEQFSVDSGGKKSDQWCEGRDSDSGGCVELDGLAGVPREGVVCADDYGTQNIRGQAGHDRGRGCVVAA